MTNQVGLMANWLRRQQVVGAVAAAAFGVAAAGAWAVIQAKAEVGQLDSAVRILERDATSAGESPPKDGPVDFVPQLPVQANADGFIKEAQRQAAQRGVLLQLLTAKVVPASMSALGRVQVSVSLRGGYGPLKETLGDLLGWQGSVLQHVVMRRQASPAEVEAQAEVMLLSRPLPTGAGH
jgi:hypothetical protein